MTLIEVLAGLVVLGTVLASVTIARGRFMQQTARAQNKIQAGHAVDAMLSSWMSGPPDLIPVPAQGALEGTSRLTWQTRWQPNPAAENLGARVVRLSVIDRFDTAGPLLSVDFVIHNFQSPATQPSGNP
jgi:type II secretory pathway pseudopilin PulG